MHARPCIMGCPANRRDVQGSGSLTRRIAGPPAQAVQRALPPVHILAGPAQAQSWRRSWSHGRRGSRCASAAVFSVGHAAQAAKKDSSGHCPRRSRSLTRIEPARSGRPECAGAAANGRPRCRHHCQTRRSVLRNSRPHPTALSDSVTLVQQVPLPFVHLLLPLTLSPELHLVHRALDLSLTFSLKPPDHTLR